MKLVIEVITFGRTLYFRERASKVVFNKLIAYRAWINGVYKIYDQEGRLIWQGKIKSLSPKVKQLSAFSGLEALIQVHASDDNSSEFIDCLSGSSFVKLLPKFFESGFEICLDVPLYHQSNEKNFYRSTKAKECLFNFRNYLVTRAELMGETMLARL